MIARVVDKPRSYREGIERLLYVSRVSFKPTFWAIFFDVLAPDGRITMDGIARDADNRAFWEEVTKYRHFASRHNTWETKRRSGMQAETFADTGIEIRQAFDLITSGDGLVF